MAGFSRGFGMTIRCSWYNWPRSANGTCSWSSTRARSSSPTITATIPPCSYASPKCHRRCCAMCCGSPGATSRHSQPPDHAKPARIGTTSRDPVRSVQSRPDPLGLQQVPAFVLRCDLEPSPHGKANDADEWIHESNPVHVVMLRAVDERADRLVAGEEPL